MEDESDTAAPDGAVRVRDLRRVPAGDRPASAISLGVQRRKAGELIVEPPVIEKMDMLAAKLSGQGSPM